LFDDEEFNFRIKRESVLVPKIDGPTQFKELFAQMILKLIETEAMKAK
jgi:hypothetical protein